MRPSLLFPLTALALSSVYQSPLYAQAKEYTALHPTAADTIPKASIISQVLPDRSVIFRLKAPDARQVSVLVGFSNPPAAMAPSYQLKKDNDGLWSTTVGPLITLNRSSGFRTDYIRLIPGHLKVPSLEHRSATPHELDMRNIGIS